MFNYVDPTHNPPNKQQILPTQEAYDNNPLYINAKSNYPSSIIGQVPLQ